MLTENFRSRAILSIVLWIGLLPGAAPAAFAQLKISSNPHYFKDGSTVIPLVGYSAEYLPHVTRPTKKNDLVTLESYQDFIKEIKARGLNTMQLWVDLNHSIGIAVDGRMQPYPAEQPFVWDVFQWRLDQFEPAFFTNLKNVIFYAASKGVFVEVTLFDPWSGVSIDSSVPTGQAWSSPWWITNNVAGVHFTETRFFVSFDNGTADIDPDNQAARAAQLSLVQKTVTELNPYTNFYWQIANEPDFDATRTEPDLNIDAMVNWHNAIATRITTTESSLPNKHEIGVNFISKAALESSVPLASSIKIVNGHYVDVTGLPARFGGITAARKYNSTSTAINKLFGFNETRATPNPTDRMSARAEAWEHMLSEGGLYDNYALQWNVPNDQLKLCTDPTIGVPTQVRCDLGRITSFLAPNPPLTFASMVRQTGSKPSWITSGVVDYGTADPLSGSNKNTYWGAMQVTGSQYLFYYHHSNTSGKGGTRYLPVPGSYTRNFTFNLAGAATGDFYKLEWFYYSPGSPTLQSTSIDSLFWGGTPVTKSTPVYNYDLALRMTKCPTHGVNCS